MRTWSADVLAVSEKHRLLRARGILGCLNGRTIPDILVAARYGSLVSIQLWRNEMASILVPATFEGQRDGVMPRWCGERESGGGRAGAKADGRGGSEFGGRCGRARG
jgi:hypothetical protein